MKLRYILGVMLSAALFAGCSDDKNIGTYGSLTEGDSFVILPADGQTDATITVNAQESWAFDEIFSTTKTVDGEKVTTRHALPTWLTASVLSGTAGETKVTFHAEATNGGRETELRLTVDGHKQFIKVRQGSMEASPSTCAEVLAGPEGKTYQVTGTVKSIANTTYGNWYMDDGTGEVYIYGTLDAKGATKNFSSLGIEVGDVVTVAGPKKLYNGTVELVDVTVVKIVKSLIKVVTPDATIGQQGSDFQVTVAYKGSGANLSIPAEAQSWLRLKDSKYKAGVKTIYDTAAPADTTIFTFSADANTDAARTAAIEFSSSNSSSTSSVVFNVKQEGVSNPPKGSGTEADPFNVAGILAYTKALGAGEESSVDIYVKGKISSIKYTYSAQYGTATYNISDDGKEENVFTVYASYFFDGDPWEDGMPQIQVGDEVTVAGKVVFYKGTTPEFAKEKSWLVSLNGRTSANDDTPTPAVGADGSTIISVADFCAAAESTEVWYQLTGTVKNLKDGDQYGNFDLEDATGSVYVYGVLSEKGGQKKQFQTLAAEKGIKNGSVITIVGTRGSYQDKIEVMNAYFVSVQ